MVVHDNWHFLSSFDLESDFLDWLGFFDFGFTEIIGDGLELFLLHLESWLFNEAHVSAHGSRLESIHVGLFHLSHWLLVLVHAHAGALKVLSGGERLSSDLVVVLHRHVDDV